MLQRLQVLLVAGVCLATGSARAEEATDTESTEPQGSARPAPEEPPTAQPRSSADTSGKEPVPEPAGWHTEITGYFRAPISMGLSSRPGPDNKTGPSSTQVSYGPNRAFDWNYYSFAYTRLQEQDWAEVFIHEKRKHVEAVVGWMGYWFQSAGFRNPDAAWVPGMAYLTLDTDFKVSDVNSNVALTVGAWWPKFGYFEKYDTYTLGRFRQIGEQLKLTVPLNSDVTVAVVQGFGTSRDGAYNFSIQGNPLYASQTALDLMAWVNVQLMLKKYFDVGLHANTEWTADPNLTQDTVVGPKSYQAVQAAHLSVAGFEANLTLPYFGHLWISPSYISVKNGWALRTGTEVMHSLGGDGIASNYMAWTGSPTDSTGSGSMVNLGFMYENTLSSVLGKPKGSTRPELIGSVFALYTKASLDLPAGTTLKQNLIKQFKYGADVTLQALDWLAFMIRGDLVNYDMDNPGLIFAAATGRVQLASHFLSGERIYLQFSRYVYGDKAVLNATWPWGQSLVAGSSVIQEGPYSGQKPDQNILKLQADIAF